MSRSPQRRPPQRRPPQLRGRDAMQLWREHSGFLALPSLLLGLLVPAAFVLVLAAGAGGWVSWALAVPVQLLLAYVAFTPLHEATHGNVGGGRDRASLDTVVGWLCAAVFLAPFPAFRWVHLRHHARTNDPDADPDCWVVGGNPLSVALRCLTIVPHYDWSVLHADRSKPVVRRVQRDTGLGFLGLLGLVAAAAVLAGPVAVLALWILPAWLASGLLAFAFDWLPHHPHDRQGRFVDTRVLPTRGPASGALHWVLLGQSHHAVHHLFPRVPWYRYRVVYRRIEDELQARGTPVVGTRAEEPLPGPGR